MTELLNIILSILAIYRLSYLIAYENGPVFIFQRLRDAINELKLKEQKKGKDSFFSSMDEGINCPYCIGFWMSLFIGSAAMFGSEYMMRIIFILGLWGAQHLIERNSKTG